MPSKIKQIKILLEPNCEELIKAPAKAPSPTDFLTNLSKLYITESDVREFSNVLVHKMLIPELMKCNANTKLPTQRSSPKTAPKVENERSKPVAVSKVSKTERSKPVAASKMAKKQTVVNQKAVPGYRVAQCIDITPRWSGHSKFPPKTEQTAKVIALNKQNLVRNAAKTTKTPSKPTPFVRTNNTVAVESGERTLTEQKNEEAMPMVKLDEIIDSNAISSLVKAIDGHKGNLKISEIIIEFCKEV